KLSLIIVDSLTSHYRKELQEKKDVNHMLSKQLSILKEMATGNTSVFVTSQVYMTMDKRGIGPIGSNMLKSWCNNLVKLDDDGKQRRIFIEKPENTAELCFEIVNEGIKTD
ncbi:MAG: hypothetical protein KJ955_02795, partial [Nanoarchaeota archaeon]|nr:hypothetical protein [Nanoarchaeota archaeon]